MKRQLGLVAASLGLSLQVASHAATHNYVCPQSIPEASVHLAAPGQEWKPFVASPLYLSGAAPADGPPERLGVLRETSSTKAKTGAMQKYTLDGRYPDGKWLRCDYGAGGEFALAKRLPDDTRECAITQRKGEHVGEHMIAIRCQ